MPAIRLTTVVLFGLLPMAGCRQHVTELPVTAAAGIEQPPQAADDPPPAPAETGPIAIIWDELDVGIPAETVFEPWMMKTSIKSLAGQPVRITGYMHGGVPVKEGIREFVLLRNIDCPFGRQGEAHHAIVVTLQGDLRTSYSTKPHIVEGTFQIRPFAGPDGSTWALYAMDGTRVSLADGKSLPSQDSIHNQDGEVAP